MLNRRLTLPAALGIALAILCSPIVSRSEAKAVSGISVTDLVQFANIGDPQTLSWNAKRPLVSAISPDGTKVAIVIRKGDPDRKTNDASIVVYDRSALLHDPEPQVVIEVSSSGNYQPVAYVRWTGDSQALVFAAAQGELLPQVFRVSLHSRELATLTRETAPLLWYDITASGSRLVTLTEKVPQPPSQDESCRRLGCRVTTDLLHKAEFGSASDETPALTVYDSRSVAARSLDSPKMSDKAIDSCDPALAGGLSPDGRFAIWLCTLNDADVPAWWYDYRLDPSMRVCVQTRSASCFRRGVIVDFDRNKSVSWTEAPLVPLVKSSAPIWIDGGRHVIFPGALEPLDIEQLDQRATRASSLAIVLMDPITKEVSRIAQLDPSAVLVTSASWDERNEIISVEARDLRNSPLPVVRYQRTTREWKLYSHVTPGANQGVQLEIRQSLNEAPMLMAMDPRNNISKRVLDPNPWLAERQIGQVEALSWEVRNGLTWRGGLYYPPGYKPGRRYPLVIQTHGFKSNEFSLHGIARNFAAQALAAHNIVVLQVAESFGEGEFGTPKEWATVQRGYESAIDYLDKRGLLDRNRTGIQGWSRTGPHVGYTLTHSSYPFAAGAFTGTADFGWLWYLSAGAPRNVESYYGAPPFGDGLDAWFKHSPTFNLDQVRTPMLMWGNGTGRVLWDWYAGLRRLGRPVDYWISPEGTHDVFQVGQRLTSNQLLVDWFRFWLKDEEDDDPSKESQYVRWRELRDMQITINRQRFTDSPWQLPEPFTEAQ